jgi:poly-beta-1,6-N-acetyl-D-glucosamine biosynthesis protein PgaD
MKYLERGHCPIGHEKYCKVSEDASIEIIDRPQLRSTLRNIGEWSFTTIMWVLWGYFFLPMINLLMWLIGGGQIYAIIIHQAHYRDLIRMIQTTGWFALAIFVVLRGWGYYNYRRYGKRERRRSVPPASVESLAAFFNLSEATTRRLQHQKEIIWEGRYESA